MEISGIASVATAMAQTRTEQAVGVALTRKALDIQASSAAALLEALPPVPNLPDHLGQNINTVA